VYRQAFFEKVIEKSFKGSQGVAGVVGVLDGLTRRGPLLHRPPDGLAYRLVVVDEHPVAARAVIL